MNIKAERIEQLIQLVNRNLSLVFAGQLEGVTPLEVRKLQKVDAVIFGHDKFAYEMVHFISSATDKLVFDRSLFAAWESNFIKGLESLLVECAVIHDDIERDCFISRVYCWFTEKLAERREVPRDVKIGVDDLKASVARTAGGQAMHTMRAIDNFRPEDTIDGRARLMAEGMNTGQAYDTGDGLDHMGHTLPPILQQPANTLQPRHPKFGARKVPLYVKHAYPGVLSGNQGHTFQPNTHQSLPKLPGAEENYGLVHNRPETAAEKTMNELWLARRQQEAFQHKTQQQLALVMDRLALHRARLESDALRRQESETMMKAIQQETKTKTKANNNPLDPNSDAEEKKDDKKKGIRGMADRLRVGMGDGSPLQSPLDAKKRHNQRRSPSPPSRSMTATEMTVSSLAGGVETQSIPAPNRIAVPKAPASGRPTNLSHTPMRFKLQLPPDYLHRQQFYMQLSDDEDDDEQNNHNNNARKNAKPSSTPAAVSHLNKGNAKNRSGSAPGATGKGEILFKHERMEIRDRPLSAMLLKDVAANDNELKVHYRHTNFRRMPLTEAQLAWCEAKEQQRKLKSDALARDLAAAVNAKGKGGKDKKDAKKENGGKKTGKAAGGKGGKDAKGNLVTDEENKIKPKYASVQEFMATHFPKFEEETNVETMAPMRAVQITEVNDIVDTFAQYHLPIKETALKKALVIPMDKPEAVCLEGLREDKEGLMRNPLPPEHWRVCKIKGGGGKKGKKKKK